MEITKPGGFESSATSIGPAISLISVELFTTPAWMRATSVATKLGLADDVIRAATVNDRACSGKAMGDAVAWVRTGVKSPGSDTGSGRLSEPLSLVSLFAPCPTRLESVTHFSALGMIEASAFSSAA